jgi:hypothetical protein
MAFEQVQLSGSPVRARGTCQRSSATDRASSRAEESSSSLYSPSVILLCAHNPTLCGARARPLRESGISLTRSYCSWAVLLQQLTAMFGRLSRSAYACCPGSGDIASSVCEAAHLRVMLMPRV